MTTDTIARGLAVGAKAKATQVATTRKLWLPSRVRQREVMATPPTVTLSASHTITSPLGVRSVGPGTGGLLNPVFRYRRGSRPVQVGSTFPNFNFVKLTGVNIGATLGSSLSTIATGVAVIHHGSEIEFLLGAHANQIVAKVNGQYVSLTPTTMANDGGLYYYYLGFGSVDRREIEIIVDGPAYFGGVYVGQTDSVSAAPPRGPRTIILGDSFIGGSGTTQSFNNLSNVMADALGWDDVRPAGLGGTGYVATNGGAGLTYDGRVAADVIAYAPDLVILWSSTNDGGNAPATVSAAAQAVIAQIKAALPNCQIVMTSLWANKGPGNFVPAYFLISDALRDLAAANSIPFIHMLEQPTFETFSAATTTLAASALAGATTISVNALLVPGGTYKFADGSHVYVKSVAGVGPTSATIDNLVNAQSNGAVLTPCGNSLWLGSGKVGATTGFGNCDLMVSSDGTHPSDAGHQMIGTALAYGLMDVL